MTATRLIRLAHRWISAAFVVGFLINAATIAALGGSQPPSWVYLFAVVPLFLLLGTGVVLFLQPYFGRRRATA